MTAHGIIRRFATALLLALIAHPAQAEWHKAESDRFVIYSDSNARDIEAFAQRLERYHAVLALRTGRDIPVPSPSNRVTVYTVGSERTLKTIYGDKNSNVAGFYIPRAGGSVAFVPNVRVSGRATDFSLVVLLHEYAHHFLISSSPFAMPRWMSEGAAEYYAAARFLDDGSVEIGLAANHRVGELNFADSVSVRELLDYELYTENRGSRYDAYYGRAWLMYHYLSSAEDRRGQLEQYWFKVVRGADSLAAGEEVFGDLTQLGKDLAAYQRSRRIAAWRIPANLIQVGKVSVTPLSPGMSEMIEVVIRSRRGVSRDEATVLLPDARAIAAQYPDDAGVLAALSEAEYDAGNDAEAIAAADRAIAIDNQAKNAYVQKGYALFRQARESDDRAAAFKVAMQPFEALNALENDHPMPLMYYYRSFAERRVQPDETAKSALLRAAELAPFDQALQLNAAMMLIRDRRNQDARFFLAPLAANPHGGGSSGRAKRLLDLLAATPDGTPVDIRNLPEEVETPDLSDAAD